MKGVQLTKMVQELELNNLTPEIDLSGIVIKTAEINRPALQLTGYLEHFANERVQIIGYVEYTYLKSLDRDVKLANYEQFLSSDIPCVIYSTRTEPDEDMIELAWALGEAIGEEIDESKPLTIFHPVETWKRTTFTDYRIEELHEQVLRDGELVKPLPAFPEIVAHAKAEKARFYEEYRRLDNQQIYKVDLSQGLYDVKRGLIDKYHEN